MKPFSDQPGTTPSTAHDPARWGLCRPHSVRQGTRITGLQLPAQERAASPPRPDNPARFGHSSPPTDAS